MFVCCESFEVFEFFICLSMMMASNVLDGIQKLELLTDAIDHVVGHV